MHHHLDSLETRSLFAASPVDTTFQYDPAAISVAAGQHVKVEKVTPMSDGRYLVLATTAKGAFVMARLQENGRLDAAFGTGGVVDIGVGVSGGIQGYEFPYQDLTVTSDSLGYAYVINNFSVTRFRGNGTRDIHFGRRGIVSFNQVLLDVEPDNAGGFDAVETNLNGASNAVALVHVDANGTQSALWNAVFQGVGNATQNPFATVTFAKVMRIDGGKFVVVASRQFYGDASNDGEDNGYETGGDADVFYLSKERAVLGTAHFDTGVAVSRADIDSDADPVTLYYGRRKLYINSGHKFYRETLSQAETPNLPDGGLLMLSTQNAIHSGSGGSYGVQTTTADLFDNLGRPDRSLNGTGAYSLADRIDPRADMVEVFAGRDSDVLVGSYAPQLDKQGNETGIDDLNLLRLWTTDNVSATLVSAGVKKHRATVTIRYRAKGGVNDTTIGDGDLAVVGLNSAPFPSYSVGNAPMSLIGKQVNADGTVLAEYRATVAAAPGYQVQTQPGSVSSNRDYTVPYLVLGDF